MPEQRMRRAVPVNVPVHKGQRRIMQSDKRLVVAMAGSGGGKTSVGAVWMMREIGLHWKEPVELQRYLVASPTHKLLAPPFDALAPWLRRLGDPKEGEAGDGWKASEKTWHLRNGAQIRFGSADNPGSLEGVHFRSAWCDEWGQVDDNAHATVMRRLAYQKGRLLITTTPYKAEGWQKRVVEESRAGTDPDTEVITFPSIWNPAYPIEEFERMRAREPAWRFAMFYEGKLTVPEGAIYPLFQEGRHVVDPIVLGHPIVRNGTTTDEMDMWPIYCGYDFGGHNPTAILWSALSPDDVLYVFGERYAAEKTSRSHFISLGIPLLPEEEHDGIGWGPQEAQIVFADPSAKQTIIDMRYSGITAVGPDNDVEEGIAAVYDRLATDRLVLFRGRTPNLIREIEGYRRGDNGKPVKVDDHSVDALRYLCMGVKRRAMQHISMEWA